MQMQMQENRSYFNHHKLALQRKVGTSEKWNEVKAASVAD